MTMIIVLPVGVFRFLMKRLETTLQTIPPGDQEEKLVALYEQYLLGVIDYEHQIRN